MSVVDILENNGLFNVKRAEGIENKARDFIVILWTPLR